MKKLIGKFKIGEMMSKILLLTILVAFVLFTGLLGNKKATAQSGMPYHCDEETCTFTGDTLIQTSTQFDNKNIIIKAEPGGVDPVVTIDGEHTFKNVTINSGTITHSPVAQDPKPGADFCPTGDLALQNKIYTSQDFFGVKWHGYLSVAGSRCGGRGTKIQIFADDGAQLWVKDTVSPYQEWTTGDFTRNQLFSLGPNDYWGCSYLPKGLYEFELRYREITGDAIVQMLDGSSRAIGSSLSDSKLYLDQAMTQPGARGEYFGNVYNNDFLTWADPEFTRTDSAIEFGWTPERPSYGGWLRDHYSGKSPFLEPATGLKLTADNVIIGSSGKIDVSGKGYPGGCGGGEIRYGYGPGGGLGYIKTTEEHKCHNIGGGGSFGGQGSMGYMFINKAEWPPPDKSPDNACCWDRVYPIGYELHPARDLLAQNIHTWYNNLTYTIPFGSGGGGGYRHAADWDPSPGRHLGGAGGGLIKINAQSITLESGSEIKANGAHGEEAEEETNSDVAGQGGGGSGGAIEIHADSWDNKNLGVGPRALGDFTRTDNKAGYFPFRGLGGTLWVGSAGEAGHPFDYGHNITANGGLLGGGGGRIAIDAPIGEAPTPPVSADSRKVKAVITWQEFGKTQTVELWTYLKDVR